MATLTNLNDFKKSGYELITAHSPLVLYWKLNDTTSSHSTGYLVATITGQSPADNQNSYTFDMAYIETIDLGGGSYDHYFKLNITDIIRKVCNSPRLESEITVGNFFQPSRLATSIKINVLVPGAPPPVQSDFTYSYMHGFNQIGDPNGSALVEFASNDQGKISIAPGAPMLFHLWKNVATSNQLYFDILKNASIVKSVLLNTGALPIALYEIYDNVNINQWLDDNFQELPILYELQLRDTTAGVLTSVFATAPKKACEGSLVLAWLNRYGTYSYLAFDKYYRRRGEQKHIGSFTEEIIDIADNQSRELSRGFENAFDKITATCHNVPSEDLEAIEDLFISMDIYMYTGTLPDYTFSTAEWIRVEVKGNLRDRKKRSAEDINVEITPPEKYTQLR
jgi:hypothetical protein